LERLEGLEAGLARSHSDELVDYIVESIVAQVGRSVVLIELCNNSPNSSLDELIRLFPWDPGLKRSPAWKRQWISDMLRSMIAAGITLRPETVTAMADEGSPIHPFNEVAYACAPERLELSWKDFKHEQSLDAQFYSIVDSDDEASVANEGMEYGSITIGQLTLKSLARDEFESLLDLRILGQELSPELTELMERMHRNRPSDGYRPIAWHNVFWNLVSDYETLWLELETREPLCETDQEIVDQIAVKYGDVLSRSRPVIYRRRTGLQTACVDVIHVRVKERLAE
jgi:hypothetical protein